MCRFRCTYVCMQNCLYTERAIPLFLTTCSAETPQSCLASPRPECDIAQPDYELNPLRLSARQLVRVLPHAIVILLGRKNIKQISIPRLSPGTRSEGTKKKKKEKCDNGKNKYRRRASYRS